MGRKVNPIAFRIGPKYTWDSRWYAKNDGQYKKLVIEDARLREALMEKLRPAGISRVVIERLINKVDITLHVAKPGMAIGRGGAGMEELKKFVVKLMGLGGQEGKKGSPKVDLLIEPVKEPALDAYLTAVMIAEQLMKRMPHRRAVNQALDKVMVAGAKGVKIRLAGRIGGAEISRTEVYKKGSLPTSTIREIIDYGEVPSLTKSGYVGVKVWISKKD